MVPINGVTKVLPVPSRVPPGISYQYRVAPVDGVPVKVTVPGPQLKLSLAATTAGAFITTSAGAEVAEQPVELIVTLKVKLTESLVVYVMVVAPGISTPFSCH